MEERPRFLETCNTVLSRGGASSRRANSPMADLDRCYTAERSHLSRPSLYFYDQDKSLTPLANASPVSEPRRFPLTFSSIRVLLRRSDSPMVGPALGMHTNSDLLAAERRVHTGDTIYVALQLPRAEIIGSPWIHRFISPRMA